MRKPVTTDITVLQGWPKKLTEVSAAAIAEALGINVFQITARLKGMQKRQLVDRTPEGAWFRTEKGLAEAKNPSPSIVKKPARQLNVLGFATGRPDDTHVPLLKLTRDDWGPSEFAWQEAKKRLPLVKQRLAEFKEQGNHQGILALRTELDHCRSVLRRPRDGRWFHRRVIQGPHITEVYVAPDGREYVEAMGFEIADLLFASATGFDPVRLRLHTTSALAREAIKTTKEIEGREAAKQEKRREKLEAAKAVLPADDTGAGWRRLTKAERKEERFRAKAESAFWGLPQERRDHIRNSGKYDSYEDWYRAALARRHDHERKKPGKKAGARKVGQARKGQRA